MTDTSAPEDWKPIDGYPGYEVRRDGQVRSWRSVSGGRRSEPKLLKRVRKIGLRNEFGEERRIELRIILREAFKP